MNPETCWERYRRGLLYDRILGLRLDISRMDIDDAALENMSPAMTRALDAMARIEGGAEANVTERRRVGHYWLRAPELAPLPAIRADIERMIGDVVSFAADVHAGRIRPTAAGSSAAAQASPSSTRFRRVLLIGIGGSALGPQFVGDALLEYGQAMALSCIDNTDPHGIARMLRAILPELHETLVLITSKSGSTIETRNGMIEVREALAARGLNLARHAVAVTAEGSALHALAQREGWLRTFPLWDWVGGRTSQTSAVGLLPAALQGIDITQFLSGARACDQATRCADIRANPAALLALSWYIAGNGRGDRAMVVIPYRDALALFPRYLQQLVMESLGKGATRDGRTVEQGLTVYGNKGSTDQHAYVQQLRDGRNDFFVTFIYALEDQVDAPVEVEPGVTSGDYLFGFLYGTREALSQRGRPSITLSLNRVDPFRVGVLIALFERAVGLYAELIDVNAYDQPGVEAGKRAAGEVIRLQAEVLRFLREHAGEPFTVCQVADGLRRSQDVEMVHHVLTRLAHTGRCACIEGDEEDAYRA